MRSDFLLGLLKRISMKNLYFVDFENLPTLSFDKINPDEDQVVVFVGKNQTKISIDTVIKTQVLGKSVVWMKMDGSGRNALDFHIAYYLGHFTASLEAAKLECNIFVVSKDGDYDILINHIQSLGHSCRRLIALDVAAEAAAKQVVPETSLAKDLEGRGVAEVAPALKIDALPSDSNKQIKFETESDVLNNLIDQLKKVDKAKRPRAGNTLMNHIIAQYQKKSINVSMLRIFEMMLKSKKISISENNRILYHF